MGERLRRLREVIRRARVARQESKAILAAHLADLRTERDWWRAELRKQRDVCTWYTNQRNSSGLNE